MANCRIYLSTTKPIQLLMYGFEFTLKQFAKNATYEYQMYATEELASLPIQHGSRHIDTSATHHRAAKQTTQDLTKEKPTKKSFIQESIIGTTDRSVNIRKNPTARNDYNCRTKRQLLCVNCYLR